MTRPEWREYLAQFHAREAGITERVLLPARDAMGKDPYAWLAGVLPTTGTVVDLACGSAPLASRLSPAVDYVGVDRSPAELALARRRLPEGRFVHGDAIDLPDLVETDLEAVACSMALQVLEPLPDVLRAVAATLRPGGALVATVPSTYAYSTADRVRWGAVLVALGRRVGYPNDRLLADLGSIAAPLGLSLEADEHRRFVLRVDGRGDAETIVDSLYLPDLASARRSAGAAAVRAAARVGGLGLSLRRVMLLRR